MTIVCYQYNIIIVIINHSFIKLPAVTRAIQVQPTLIRLLDEHSFDVWLNVRVMKSHP